MMRASPGRKSPTIRARQAASAAAICRSRESIRKIPTVVYVASTVTMRSADGGKTWSGFRGAPGGDDYQNLWINPNNGNIILLVSDQGAIITVNRRRDLEFLVQPADGAALSRDRRQFFSLSRVRRAAGERLGLHLEPRQRWRDRLSRLASGGSDRIRLCRSRPARSRRHLRRRQNGSLEISLVHRASAERHSDSAAQRQSIAPIAPSL